MAPTPITTTHRLRLNIAIDGLTHFMDFYLNAQPDLLDPTGWSALGWDTSQIDIGVLADKLFTDLVGNYQSAEVSFVGWELDELSGTAWVYVIAGSTTVSPGAGHTPSFGMAVYIIVKDDHNKFMKAYIQEPRQAITGKFSGQAAVVAVFPLAADLMDFSSSGAGNYIRSRGGNKLQRVISAVISTNRKLRRRRNIA